MSIRAREMPAWSLFIKVRMTESISDMHECIYARLTPAGPASLFLHHSQWPEAQTDLRYLPRATREVSGSLLEEILHHQSPGKDQCSHQAPHSLLLRELVRKMPVSLAPGTISTYKHTFSYANKQTTEFRGNASEPSKEVLTFRRLIIFYPK